MCTAISMKTKEHYFGRNLDLDRSYGEEVCVVPRKYPLRFRKVGEMTKHYTVVGMASVVNNIPLFYDAANECGLAMAGLNFPENAHYHSIHQGKDNIAPFELVSWVLGQCKSVADTKNLLKKLNIVNIQFSEKLPNSPLHWMIADKTQSIVVESMKDGIHIYDNPVNVLTNNPPFKYHLENLDKYKHLRTDNKNVVKENNLGYCAYSQGLGAVGLPGDAASMSRFVRAAFTLKSSVCDGDEASSVGQFFHILSSVQMVKGTVITDEKTLDITAYSSCINTDKGIYYYTTYNNRQICCVDMYKTDLNCGKISRFGLVNEQNIMHLN